MVCDRKQSRHSGHFWLYLRTAGLSSWQAALAIFFHNSLPLNKLHYCLLGVPCATPLKICQGASSSKGVEFGGLGQAAIQRFWTFLAAPENSGAFFLAGCPGQFFSQFPTLKQTAGQVVRLVAVWCGDFGAWGAAGTGRSVALDSIVSTLKNSILGREHLCGISGSFFPVIPTLFAFQESE